MKELAQIGVFGALSWILLCIAKRRGYFSELDPKTEVHPPQVGWGYVIGAFALYFTIGMLALTYLVAMLQGHGVLFGVREITWCNFFGGLVVFLCILAMSRKQFRLIWRWKEGSYFQDLKVMLITMILGLPVVFAGSGLFEVLVHLISGQVSLPDQTAVYWLKMTFPHPFSFFLTTISIVVIAPLLEETLFRGYLQSLFRRYASPRPAIFLSSLCFALFHFTSAQKLSNFPIIASLFLFALFLGYIYEKQGSLFASISLHSFFNALNLVQIYFLGDCF